MQLSFAFSCAEQKTNRCLLFDAIDIKTEAFAFGIPPSIADGVIAFGGADADHSKKWGLSELRSRQAFEEAQI